MLPGHAVGQEADGRLAMQASGEGDVLTPKEVPAVQRHEHEVVRLARRIAEHLEGLTTSHLDTHRNSLPIARGSCGVPPRVPPSDRSPNIRNPALVFPLRCPRW